MRAYPDCNGDPGRPGGSVYLDHNATSPMRAEAREAWARWAGVPANPSSTHKAGRAAAAAVERARGVLLAAVGAPGGAVTFTSGATEAANLVLTPRMAMGRAAVPHTRLLVSAVEHPCVLRGGRFPADAVERLPVDTQGRVDGAALEAALAREAERGRRSMVAVQLANSETGVLQDVASLAALVRGAGGTFVCDAVQALDRVPVDMAALGVDFLIVSSHKIGGPPGAGALVARGPMLAPAPLMTGGGQEDGLRAGTPNVAAIAGFAAAVEARAGLQAAETIRTRRDRFERGARRLAPTITIHGAGAERLPNTSAFSFAAIEAETAAIAFDLDAVAVSAGSACASGTARSHVVEAMGGGASVGTPHSALRVSLGPDTSDADIDAALATLARLGARDAEKLERARPRAA